MSAVETFKVNAAAAQRKYDIEPRLGAYFHSTRASRVALRWQLLIVGAHFDVVYFRY